MLCAAIPPSSFDLASGSAAKGAKSLHKPHLRLLRHSAACHRHSPRGIHGRLSVSLFAIWMPGSARHLSDRKELPDLAWASLVGRIMRIAFPSEVIERALDPETAAVQDMRVDHRRLDAAVAQQLLDRPDVVTACQKMRRE